MFAKSFAAVAAVALLCHPVFGSGGSAPAGASGPASAAGPQAASTDPGAPAANSRPPAAAGTDTLRVTQARVIKLAGAKSLQVLEADSRLAEARGRLGGARAPALDNPEVEIVTGDPAGARRTQAELSVPIGPGIKRARRIGLARAEVEREACLARDARRLAVGTALESWYRLLYARGRLDLANRRVDLARQLQESVEERFRSGDAARLDVNVAATDLSRSIAEVSSLRQNEAAARADLAALLGIPLDSAWVVSGDLADRGLFESALRDSAVGARPDVEAAESALRIASAQRSLAGAGVLPEFAFRLNYENSEGDIAWLPGLAMTVPLFNRGQGEAAAARARQEFARIELDRRRMAATLELAAAREAYVAAAGSVDELEKRALPVALETDRMIVESYRAGKTNLATMLLLRREMLETRRDYLDRLLEAALSGVNLGLATGVWP